MPQSIRPKKLDIQPLDIQPIESSTPSQLDIQPLDIQPVQSTPTADDVMNYVTSPMAPPIEGEPVVIDNKSRLRQMWDLATSPLTDLPSRIGRSLSEDITMPKLPGQVPEWLGNLGITDESIARAKGFYGGALEGIGDVISGFTSPLNIATLGAGALESAGVRGGIGALARIGNLGVKGLSAPVAAEGAYHIGTGETLKDKLFGVAELAGGIAGLKQKLPNIASRAAGAIPETTVTDVASSMGRTAPILDESGRVIVEPENVPANITPDRPIGPWDANTSIIPEQPIVEPPIQPIVEPPVEVTPQFNRPGVLGETGNLQRIGDDIVNPQTGEIIDFPVRQEILPPEQHVVTPDMDEKTAWFVKDTQRMADERYKASQDPVKVATEQKKISDWNTTQRNIRINDFIEKNMPVDPETGFAKSYDKLTPEEQQFRDALFDKINKSDLTVENPNKFNNFKMRLVDENGNEVSLVDFAADINELPSSATPELPASQALDIQPIESTEVKGTAGTKSNTPKTGNLELIKQGEITPQKVKEMKEAGYEFSELTAEGDFVFKKSTSRPSRVPVLESEVGVNRPTQSRARQQMGPNIDEPKTSITNEIANFPRTMMASMDMSAPLRQGIGLIHKKQFWTSLDDMFRAFGSENAFNQIQKSISDKPLFKRRIIDGKEVPSFAEDAGLKLTDLHDLSNREEMFLSKLALKLPGVRRSNRAYVAFLNKLRADTFESLIRDGKIFGSDATVNVPLARGIADFVNTATGRGSLDFRLNIKGQQYGLNLEPSAQLLGTTFFAPRLIASRLRILNPAYYIMADPFVRKEALKSLFAIASAGIGIGQLARLAGADVESNPSSADFGKIRIGNTRLDPFAGFQQYIVAANRLAPEGLTSKTGQMKSTVTGQTYKFSERRFGRSTRADVALRFGRSKLNPILGMAWDIAEGKDITGKSLDVREELASKFVPIFVQDLKQLLTEDPNLIPNIHRPGAYKELHLENLPLAVPAFFGMGGQTYPSRRR